MMAKCLQCSQSFPSSNFLNAAEGLGAVTFPIVSGLLENEGLKASINELGCHLQSFAQGEARHVGVRPDGDLQLSETSQNNNSVNYVHET